MPERRLYIAQCLCGPNRHAIGAFAGEFDSETAAQALLPKLREAIAELRKSVNPWCAICGATEEAWRYEIGRAPYRTLQEAMPELARAVAANAVANAILGSHGPQRPGQG